VMITLAAKFMPLISLWEMGEHPGEEKAPQLPATEPLR